jgi:tetratricopeptide (TPR) repeat protein
LGLFSLNRHEEAIEAYDKAIELSPRVAAYHFRRGLSLQFSGRPEEAVDAYDEARELEPTRSDALNMKGIALFDLHRFSDATATYKRAIEVDPDCAEAYVNLANSLDYLGQPDEALALYDQAAAIDPESSYVALLNKVITLRQLGRHEAAQLVSQEVAKAEAQLDGAETLELEEFMRSYYQRPQPLQVESAIRQLDQSGILSLDTAEAGTIGFFAEVFMRHPDMRESWREVVNEQSDKTRSVLQRALTIAENPKTTISEMESSTARNDMLWGAFFAGGDDFYIRALADELRYLDEAHDDPNLFQTAATAKWSLSVNARDHEAVRLILEAMIAEETFPFRSAVRDLLRQDPEEILERLSDTTRPVHWWDHLRRRLTGSV